MAHTGVKSSDTLVSRLRLDAALFDEIEISPVKLRGRKPVRGAKILPLKEQIKAGSIDWQESRIAWYGNELKTVKLATGVNLWYKPSEKPLKIRWVLVQAPITPFSDTA